MGLTRRVGAGAVATATAVSALLVLSPNMVVAGSCSPGVGAATVNCTGAAGDGGMPDPAYRRGGFGPDAADTFPESGSVSLTMGPSAGIDTRADTTVDNAIAIWMTGDVIANLAAGSSLGAHGAAFHAYGEGGVNVTAAGSVHSAYGAAYDMRSHGDLIASIGGDVYGGSNGVSAVKTGAGVLNVAVSDGASIITGAENAVYPSGPFPGPVAVDTLTLATNFPVAVFADHGGDGDATVSIGVNATVAGFNGVSAYLSGRGVLNISTGDGSSVRGHGLSDVPDSALAGTGFGISGYVSNPAATLRMSTGDNALVEGAQYGLIAQNYGEQATIIETGAGSQTLSDQFAILGAGGGVSAFNATLGAGSRTIGGVSGLMALGGSNGLSVNTGAGSLVEGGWAGMVINAVGDASIVTGAGSTVRGAGTNMPMGLPFSFYVPNDTIGLPEGSTFGFGIVAMVGSQPTDGWRNASITTGADSVVEARGNYNNAIHVNGVFANGGAVQVTTGDRSLVEGGAAGIAMPQGMAAGAGIQVQAIGAGLTADAPPVDVSIVTGAGSVTRAGPVGIAAMAHGGYAPATLNITTGPGSLVEATAAPITLTQGDETYMTVSRLPTMGIAASTYGAFASSVHVATGESSIVRGASFGIAAMPGVYNGPGVANPGVTINVGANSQVLATGEGPMAYAIMEGVRGDMGILGEAAGMANLSAGIHVGSVQFNAFIAQYAPTGDPDNPYDVLAMGPAKAAPVNITTAPGSLVRGVGNGVSVASFIVAQEMIALDGEGNIVDIASPDVVHLEPVIVPYAGIAGDVTITVNGTATGETAHGVYAAHGGNATLTTVNVGPTSVVQGAIDGVHVASVDPATQPEIASQLFFGLDQSAAEAVINNAGEIRNLSGVSSDRAITTSRTTTTINNAGLVTGVVNLDSERGNRFINRSGGVWNTANGVNEMGAARMLNSISNEAGASIVAAADAGVTETTVFNGLGVLANAGLITMQDGAPGDRAIINGDYVGQGGRVALDTHLGPDASPSDLLHVSGATSGASFLQVRNAGGAGAQTLADGIKVVQVDGASNGVFRLIGDYSIAGQPAVVAGAYGYTLWQNGVTDPADGDWYLRSQLAPVAPTAEHHVATPLYQPGAPVYESYPQILQALNGLPTLQQRVGNRYWSQLGLAPGETGVNGAVAQGSGAWARIEGVLERWRPATSTTGARSNASVFSLQAGLDGLLTSTADGVLVGGLNYRYGSANTDVFSRFGDGRIRTTGHGVGATLTWYGYNGVYVDAQAHATWYNSDLTSLLAGRQLARDNGGFGYALSVEAGRRTPLNARWAVTPQAQLVWSHVSFDSFVDPFRAPVSAGRGDNLLARLGVALDGRETWRNSRGMANRLHIYGVANLYYAFGDGTRVDVAGVSLTQRQDRVWAGVGVGGSYNWDDDRYSLYAEGSANTSLASFGQSFNAKGTLGFRMRF